MSSDKLKKLEDLLKMVTEGLTKEEFVNSFEEVVKFIKKIETSNKAEFDEMKQVFAGMKDKIDQLAEKLRDENENNFAEETVKLGEKISDEMNAILKSMEASHKEMRTEINKLSDKMPNEDDIIDAAKKETEEEIENLNDKLVKLEEYVKKIPTGRVTSGAGMNLPTHQQFTMNGTDTTITLNDPIGAGTLAATVYYNGMEIFRGTGYTVSHSGKKIDFLFTPDNGDKVDVIYYTIFRTI